MKKGWRDKRVKADDVASQKLEEVRVQANFAERDGKQYGVIDLSFILKLGLPKEAVDDVAAALQKGPLCTVAADPITRVPTVWLGPWDDRTAAEVATRGTVKLICDVLGVPQGMGPQLRQHDKGVIADWNTSNQTNPKQLGGPPGDLEQRVARGKEIAEGPDDALTLVIAAWQRLLRDDPEAHILRLVMLARGVVSWIAKVGAQTPLLELEERARGLARLIADNIPRSDEFVLLLANSGEGGFYTHISSIGRDTTIALLTEYLNALRGDKAKSDN